MVYCSIYRPKKDDLECPTHEGEHEVSHSQTQGLRNDKTRKNRETKEVNKQRSLVL